MQLQKNTNEGTTRFLVEKAAAVFFCCFIDWGFHEPLERFSPVGPPNPVWCQDTIKRFGGPSAPSAPWPREHAAQEEAEMWVERWGDTGGWKSKGGEGMRYEYETVIERFVACLG